MFPLPFITRYLVETGDTVCSFSRASGCFCFNESVSGDGCGKNFKKCIPKSLGSTSAIRPHNAIFKTPPKKIFFIPSNSKKGFLVKFKIVSQKLEWLGAASVCLQTCELHEDRILHNHLIFPSHKACSIVGAH